MAKKQRKTSGNSSTGKKGPGTPAAEVEAKFVRVVAELRCVLRTKDVPEMLVLVLVGYAHPASTGYVKVKNKLRKDNIISFSKGLIRFTQHGLDTAIPEDVQPPTDNREVQGRFRSLLHSKIVSTSMDKFDRIFDILLDGQVHTKGELLAAAGYNHPQSTGFVNIMSALKDLKVLESDTGNKKAVMLADILFPFGRPTVGRA